METVTRCFRQKDARDAYVRRKMWLPLEETFGRSEKDPTVADKNDCGQRINAKEPDERIATTNVPNAAIAVSNGRNDT